MATHSPGPDARHAAPPPRPRRRRRWPAAAALTVLGVAGWGVWLVSDTLQAKEELAQTAGLVATLRDEVLRGDREAAAATLAQVQAHAQAGRDHTRGPQWSAAAALPWVGPNVEAIQVVADVLDDLSSTAMPGLMDAAAAIEPDALAPTGGLVDTGSLDDVGPTVTAAHDAVAEATERLALVDVGALWAPVAEPFAQVKDQVAAVAATTATASRAAELLPGMLGATEPRDYLLVVQDNAELRATGGVPRELALLHAEAGVVTITETRSGGSLGDLGAPVLPLTESESLLFGPDLAADVRNATVTPDFPRSAQIMATLWARQVGGAVDGVISVDPGAIALLLDDVGPVPLTPGPMADALGGQLTADNVAQAMLSTVYLTLPDAAARDAFFAEAVTSVLGAFLAGQGESAAAVDALAEAARRGRLLVWSAHADEQALLGGTVLSGALVGETGASPVVGVFLNDGTQAKLGYYVESEVGLDVVECRPDGTRLVTVTVMLTNTLPPDAVAGLPPYVVGATGAVPPGDVVTGVRLYAPAGGTLEAVQVGGADGGAPGLHGDLATVEEVVQLAPGTSQTVSAQVVTSASSDGPVGLRTTPVARGEASVVEGLRCS